MRVRRIDYLLLMLTALLLIAGLSIFFSASLGLILRENYNFYLIVTKQLGIGMAGAVLLFVFSRIRYEVWFGVAPILYVSALLLMILVFIPSFGFESGGAKRWLSISGYTFQPAEILKFASILLLSRIYANRINRGNKSNTFISSFLCILMFGGALLLSQPDTGTLLVLGAGLFSIFFLAGANWKHISALFFVGVLIVFALSLFRPYVKERILTFIDPLRDTQGSSYQIQQSLLAIGSGNITGRGFGASTQKFSFLPESTGDSIFAIAAEEFGFIGILLLLSLFFLLGLRGYQIAGRVSDPFGKYVTVGFTTMIMVQSYLHMAATLGLVPLTGVPLIFVSHGGTSLLFALIEIGIILNVSKSMRS